MNTAARLIVPMVAASLLVGCTARPVPTLPTAPSTTAAPGTPAAAATAAQTTAAGPSATAASTAPTTAPTPTTALTAATAGSADSGVDPSIAVYADCQVASVTPPRLVLACADQNVVVTGLHWSTWNAAGAHGIGTLSYNDCTPNCAVGGRHSVPATQISLSAPVDGADGQLVFSRVQESPQPPGYATGPFHGGPQPLATGPN